MSKIGTIEIAVPAGLASGLAEIAAARGLPIDAEELAEGLRLFEACRRAAEDLPTDAGDQTGVLHRAIPCGDLVVRTPTIRARLKLRELQGWPLPEDLATVRARAEYVAVLTAWVLANGREGEELAMLSEATAPAIVADTLPRMGCTLAELNAAIGEVVRDLYPPADIMDVWDPPDEDPDAETDWAAVLLALSDATHSGTEAWLDAYEPHAMHMLAALRRRRAAERAQMDSGSSAAPDPQSPKCRAARAMDRFEKALLSRRRAEPEGERGPGPTDPDASGGRGDVSPQDPPNMRSDTAEAAGSKRAAIAGAAKGIVALVALTFLATGCICPAVGLATETVARPRAANAGLIGAQSPVADMASYPDLTVGRPKGAIRGARRYCRVANLPAVSSFSREEAEVRSLIAVARRRAMSALPAAIPAAPPIEMVDGQPMTRSTSVAEFFGKRHKDVTRAIRNMEIPPEEHERNFAPMFLPLAIGNGATRQTKAYMMTRDGFTLVAFGFTGRAALQFKLAYIQAFNAMEAKLAAAPIGAAATFAPDLQNRLYYAGAPVLPSSSLAVFYRTSAKRLNNLVRGPRKLFASGVHYHVVSGCDVRRLYSEAAEVAVCMLPVGTPKALMVFTDSGARDLALAVGPHAQDAYLHLQRTYYAPQPDRWAGPAGCLDSAMRRAEQLLGTLQQQTHRLRPVMHALNA